MLLLHAFHMAPQLQKKSSHAIFQVKSTKNIVTYKYQPFMFMHCPIVTGYFTLLPTCWIQTKQVNMS